MTDVLIDIFTDLFHVQRTYGLNRTCFEIVFRILLFLNGQGCLVNPVLLNIPIHESL